MQKPIPPQLQRAISNGTFDKISRYIFNHCFRRGKEKMRELCKVAGENCIYKFSRNKKFEL